jgi:guanylate kinase
VERLVERDPALRLSRSWTTRLQRPGEPDDAYVFVDRPTFEARIGAGGFLEWTEFLGNYYGTPMPDVTDDVDLVLEIEVDGAGQVKAMVPDALLILVVPPSVAEQERRLRGRGDDEAHVRSRIAKAAEELAAARHLGAHEVVNDDLERAVWAAAEVIAEARRSRDRKA